MLGGTGMSESTTNHFLFLLKGELYHVCMYICNYAMYIVVQKVMAF